MWWRPDFETLLYPFLPPNVKQPKVHNTIGLFIQFLIGDGIVSWSCFVVQECTKVFLVKLPASRKFIVPKNMRLLAVPLCQVHENHKVQARESKCKENVWVALISDIIKPSQYYWKLVCGWSGGYLFQFIYVYKLKPNFRITCSN